MDVEARGTALGLQTEARQEDLVNGPVGIMTFRWSAPEHAADEVLIREAS